ncbi:MAG: hypothetical protein R3D25_17010 [Geminicoccaceae bacterium]
MPHPPLPGSEVYQALQTGVIDAGLTDVSAAFSRKVLRGAGVRHVAPFFTVYFHLFVNSGLVCGLLRGRARTAIAAAAAAAELASIPTTEATAEEAIQELEEVAGMKLHLQTPEEAAAFSSCSRR